MAIRAAALAVERDGHRFVSAAGGVGTERGDDDDRLVEDSEDPVLAALRADNEDLRARQATLPVIEQAKGVLIASYQIDAETAFALLRRWSSHANVKLRDIARLLVDTTSRSPDCGVVDQARLPADLRLLLRRHNRSDGARPGRGANV